MGERETWAKWEEQRHYCNSRWTGSRWWQTPKTTVVVSGWSAQATLPLSGFSLGLSSSTCPRWCILEISLRKTYSPAAFGEPGACGTGAGAGHRSKSSVGLIEGVELTWPYWTKTKGLVCDGQSEVPGLTVYFGSCDSLSLCPWSPYCPACSVKVWDKWLNSKCRTHLKEYWNVKRDFTVHREMIQIDPGQERAGG